MKKTSYIIFATLLLIVIGEVLFFFALGMTARPWEINYNEYNGDETDQPEVVEVVETVVEPSYYMVEVTSDSTGIVLSIPQEMKVSLGLEDEPAIFTNGDRVIVLK